jgi:hypothetical protein
MKTYSKIMMAVTLPLVLLACTDKGDSSPTPVNANVNGIPYSSSDFKLCRNAEAQQPASNDSLQNVYSFSYVIPTETVRATSCDGQVKEFQKGDQEFNERITILPPFNLRSRVQTVKVYNHLDCGTATISTSERGMKTPVFMGQERASEYPEYTSQITKRGLVKLALADGEYREGYDKMNVVNGRNVLEVVYYGKNAEEVGRKLITVNVNIERPMRPGIRNSYEDNCGYNNRRHR